MNEIIEVQPYSIVRSLKEKIYVNALSALTLHHYESCIKYRRILDVLGFDPNTAVSMEDFPFIPVRMFKDYELLSVDKSEVVKTMTSSGTTGQSVSKIFLDKTTAGFQTKVLIKILSSFIGTKRLPMLVIDSKSVIKDRNLFSARGAGILGFAMSGYDVTYALDDAMKIDMPIIEAFLQKHKDEQIMLFGFTFIIWEYFCNALKTLGVRIALDKAILFHGGGWKRLHDNAVDNETFKESIKEITGISKIYNYYGMVEQTGSVFMECEAGYLHTSIFSDLIIRDHKSFSSLGIGQRGLVQLISLIPLSYPGHSILSEDIGEVCGVDDCTCGRNGKRFRIYGRVQNAEVRGCSDTYDARKQ